VGTGWTTERDIRRRIFRLTDLVGDSDILDGRTFEECIIYGPAVVVPLDDVEISGSSFEGDANSMFWEIPESRQQVVGAIGLRECAFRRCSFRKIGLAGSAAAIAHFRAGISGPDIQSEG
jgi:hypothetical protein